MHRRTAKTPTSRAAEDALLTRCVETARTPGASARNQREANFFRLAAIVVESSAPRESTELLQASARWFADHPGEELSPSEVFRRGWIPTLPRLRDMLARRFSER